jgi:hypothetical protein
MGALDFIAMFEVGRDNRATFQIKEPHETRHP